MESKLIIYISCVFLPGIIVTTILQLFNFQNKRYTNNELYLYSFVNGLVVNMIVSLPNFFQNKNIIILDLINKKSVDLPPIDFKYLIFCVGLAIVLGLLLSALRTRGTIHRFAQRFSITNESGYSDVMTEIYNSQKEDCKKLRDTYAHIKLLDGSASYYGEVKSVEKHDSHLEIRMEDVDIYFKNNENNPSYTQKAVYLNLPFGTYTLEYYDLENSETAQSEVSNTIININSANIEIQNGSINSRENND